MKNMPSSLVMPLVIATLLGVFAMMGVFGSCVGALSMVGQGSYPMPAPMAETFDLVMSRSRLIAVASVGVTLLFSLPAGAMLLWGAFGAVTRRPDGGTWLVRGFTWAAVSEVAMFAFGLATQAAVMGPTLELLDVATTMPSNNPPPEFMQSLGTVIVVILVAATLLSLAWTVLKLAAIVWSRRRVMGEEARAWLAGPED